MRKLIIAAFLLLLLLCGCAADPAAPVETPQTAETINPTPAATPEPTGTPTPVSTPTPTPEVIDESFQVEVSDYFFRCADIVDVFPEGTTRELWKRQTPAWHYQGFWFVFEDDPEFGRDFCMQNDLPNRVTLCGGRVGEHYSDFEKGLIAAGWKAAYIGDDIHEYGIKMQGTCFLLDLYLSEDGVVKEWYLGNRPQGDYYEFYLQFDD